MNRNTTGAVIAAVAIMSLWPAHTFAQAKVTVAGGVNAANVSLDTDLPGGVDPESIRRITVGGGLEVPLGGALSLHLGAAYAQKGFAISAFGASVTTEADYLEGTALLGMSIDAGGLALHGLAGPTAGLNLSCTSRASVMSPAPGAGGGSEISDDCADDTADTDFGLAGGARAELALSGRLGLSFTALYHFGLTNVDDTTSDDSVTHRVLSLQAGFVYSLR